MAGSGPESGYDKIDWAKLAANSSSSSALDEEELVHRIALRRSRTDLDGGSSSTTS